jgi:hypothetical protein
MNKVIAVIVTIATSISVYSQQNPVSWNVTQNNSIIKFDANIEKGWHLYAVYLPSPNDGPLPTLFEFDSTNAYFLKDSTIQKDPITHFDADFGVEVSYYEDQAFFKQQIDIIKKSSFTINGLISYMCCNNETCIPLEKEFSIIVNQD